LGTDPVFPLSPNWISQPSAGFDTGREIIQYNHAYASIRSLTLNNFRKIQYTYFLKTKAEEYSLLNFFYTQRGRLKRFWLPVNYQEFLISSPITSGDNHFHIIDSGISLILKGYERLYLVLKTGDQISRKIVSATGTTQLNISGIFDRNISLSDIRTAGLILLVRFDQDEIELRHTTDNLSECQITFKELPDEYTYDD
jgi:hypothetical protein